MKFYEFHDNFVWTEMATIKIEGSVDTFSGISCFSFVTIDLNTMFMGVSDETSVKFYQFQESSESGVDLEFDL